MSWQMEKPILFFINYVYLTDVMSLGQMLLGPYYLLMLSLWFMVLLWNHVGVRG